MEKEHDGSSWGSTGYKYSGHDVAKVIDDRPYLRTALDYGCGKGKLAMMMARLDWQEYDPGIPGKQEKPRGQYDLVTCTDVMEHVEREYIEDVARELGAYTKKCLFLDIACYPTGSYFMEGPHKGEDMHITLLSPNEWSNVFGENSGLQFLQSKVISKWSKGKLKERVQLIYERV